MRFFIRGKYSSALPQRPKRQDETFDPDRNASMDSPPCNSFKTNNRGRTSPELYSGPFDPRFVRFLASSLLHCPGGSLPLLLRFYPTMATE